MNTLFKKLIVTSVAIIVSTFSFAQIPMSFNYQAIIKDNADNILANKNIGVQISIIQNNINFLYYFQFYLSADRISLQKNKT